MLILNKWNTKKHTYEDYIVPDDWKCRTYLQDLDEIVNCCQCGRKLKYGECYTSLEVHINFGIGFGVCEECYEKEWQRRNNEIWEEEKKRKRINHKSI